MSDAIAARYKALRRDAFRTPHKGSRFVVTGSILDDIGPGGKRGLHMTKSEEKEFYSALKRLSRGLLI